MITFFKAIKSETGSRTLKLTFQKHELESEPQNPEGTSP